MNPDSDYLSLTASVFADVTVAPLGDWGALAIVLAALALFMSALVSSFEEAFFSLSSTSMEEIEDAKSKRDRMIYSLLANEGRLQTSIVVANSFFNALAVLLCGFAFWRSFHFVHFAMEFVLVLAVVFLFVALLGELLPRAYAASNPLKTMRFAAPAVLVVDKIFYPVVWVYLKFASSSGGRFTRCRRSISVDELSQALDLDDGGGAPNDNNMLKGIVKFTDESVREVMTSRLDMVGVDVTATYEQLMDCIVKNVYSRIPVFEDTRDNVKGILYIKDLFPYLDRPAAFEWQSLIRPAFFVPETKKIDELLKEFQKNKVHIAIAVDEFGGTSGLITMEDIIEEIVGDIQDEYDDDEKLYVKLDSNTYVFEAKILLSDFYKVIGSEPGDVEEAAGDSDTLAGLLLETKGEFPALHEHVKIGIYDFEVLEADSRRILKVKLTIDEEK